MLHVRIELLLERPVNGAAKRIAYSEMSCDSKLDSAELLRLLA
jgi:hypothetical protein